MKKVKIDNKYKEKKILLSEFLVLDNDAQVSKIEETLKFMCEDKTEISKSSIMKCLKLSISKNDDYLYLANSLIVEKDDRNLVFKFGKQTKKLPLFILLISILLIGLFSATYSGLLFLEARDLNKDIDGDGIPDLNIDIDGDGEPDVNIDTDGDGIPDLNIDYKGNRKPMFNVDEDGDGEPDKNIITDASKDPSACTTNCDINGDGWPDQDYDIDNDGIPDFDIDTDDDGNVDGSIDVNGDLVCDIMCDDDGDGECDRACVPYDPEEDEEITGSGSSEVTGNEDSSLTSGTLNIEYLDNGELEVSGLVPDDHPEGIRYIEKQFSVTNKSNFAIDYKMDFIIESNTFVTNNFMYTITSTNDGFSSEYQTVPWENKLLASLVTIEAGQTQNYTITFKIQGINEPQNEDQGKSFLGHIKIGE